MRNILVNAKNKKIEFFAYGILLFIFFGGSFGLYYDLVRERNRIICDKSQIAMEKSKFMSQWLKTLFLSGDYVLQDVRDKVNPDDLITATPEKIRQINLWLGKKSATVPGLLAIGIFDSNRIYRADNIPQIIGYHTNITLPTSRADDKVNFQYMPIEKSANKRPTILLYRCVFSNYGNVIGGLSAAIDIEFTQGWIQSFNVDLTDVMALIDENGTLLASNPPKSKDLGNKIDLFNSQSVNFKTTGSSNFISFSSIEGVERIYGITRMDELPLVLVVGYDLKTILNEWNNRAWQMFTGFIMLICLAFFAVRAYIKSLRQGKELFKLATTDNLTGIYNRRVLFENGEREVSRINRYGSTLSILIFDIDHFKKINDTWGHSSGDRVIKVMAQTLSKCKRNLDVVGRIGGEEFVVLLPETKQEGALVIAERMRIVIQNSTDATTENGSIINFSVSIGLVTVDKGESFHDALNRADKGLYLAKKNGRNRVEIGT